MKLQPSGQPAVDLRQYGRDLRARHERPRGRPRRIGSDLRSYYLLGYTPKNEPFDGRFRKIAVRVKRKGVDVRARSGYFAVRSAGPVLAHVAPALALLERASGRGSISDRGGHGVPRRRRPRTGQRRRDRARYRRGPPGREGEGPAGRDPAGAGPRADGPAVDAMSRRFVVERGTAAADLCCCATHGCFRGRTPSRPSPTTPGRAGPAPPARSSRSADGARPLDCAQVSSFKGPCPWPGSRSSSRRATPSASGT